MFSNLGSILIRPPRQAEHADTRAEIRRHDPDQQKRQKKDHESEPENFFDTDDTATINVAALAVFLDNFLNTQTGPAEKNANIQISQEENAGQADPLSPAARAASAYARADHVSRPPEIQAAPANTGAPSLSAEDLRLMHKVRGGVEILLQRNIELLKIEKGESFLASLDASVTKILNG